MGNRGMERGMEREKPESLKRNRGMERGMERKKPESLKPGTRKAGIFKTRNEKSRNL